MTSAGDGRPIEAGSILGAVLAGGQSRRIGSDKAKLAFQGRTLIQHVAGVMSEVFADVVIISGRELRYEFVGLPVLPDVFPNRGPLGGIHTALNHARGRPVFAAACDLPFISPDLIELILDRVGHPSLSTGSPGGWARADKPRVAFPVAGDIVQPLCGFYSHACLALIEERLQNNRLGVIDFIETIDVLQIDITPLEFYREGLLLNVNSPEDCEKMLDESRRYSEKSKRSCSARVAGSPKTDRVDPL